MSYVLIYFKGMLMGIADLVPGVSGGTIALITGIYKRLINAIAAINLKALSQLFSGKFKSFWQQIDGWFLLSIFLGILTSVFLFAHLIKYLLTNHAVLTWSFFFGLIVSSAVLLLMHNKTSHLLNWFLLVFGIFLGYLLNTQSMGILPAGSMGIFLAGMIAVCAMILPGISGSLILILLGKYQVVLHALSNKEWMTLIIFALGCLVGLLTFSKVLKWLLSHFYQATIYVLVGLMLGTLFKVWPWKSITGNVIPFQHHDPQIFYAISLMFIASLFVIIISKIKS